ncbi:mechanosensitive ion channel family protein [Sediminitomix flava]|uniref:Mechanosensitive ion channel-like protein n=1 Tax=Sediminitomix flava TaxID=379075 RepID=A0A315Z982_SEDFL|nr:mechanosensitive ion channel domain-containing protein [Sediminitomix flava]PWJ40096.1 mechanosensitive ion channel-like protein [Sediminitomix flava]
MNNTSKYIKKNFFFSLIIFGLFIFSNKAQAQITEELLVPVDSTKTLTIPVEKVISTSLQTTIKLNKISKSLIPVERIEKDKIKSDSILAVIDTLLSIEKKVNLDSLLSRELNDKKAFWNGYKDILDKEVSNIQSNISDLSTKGKAVNTEYKLWMNTSNLTDSVYTDSLYSLTINEMIQLSDSVSNLILERKTICFASLKNLKLYYFKVDDLLSEINTINKQRQEKLLNQTHPSLFGLSYMEPSQWDFISTLKTFKRNNLLIINHFYQSNSLRVLLFGLYLTLLIILFIYLNKKSDFEVLSHQNVYQRSTAIILKRPLSIAVIIAIFTSGFFFSDRPPILIDISIIILTIPILDIVAHVSNKRGKIYLIAYAVLILLRFSNYIFAPSTAIHRLTILAMGIIELFLMSTLYKKLDISEITSKAFNQFVRFIILFHIIAASIGILANFTGHLVLADVSIDISITNTLVGLLLIIFTMLTVGLLQYGIESSFCKKSHFIRKRTKFLKKNIEVIILFITSFLWFTYILQILRINDTAKQLFTSVFGFNISLGTTSFSIWNVLLFFFIIWLSVKVSDLVKAILEDDILDRLKLKKGVPRIISATVKFSLITAGILLAISAVGMPLDQLTIIISAFSVGIGFGLQNIVSNFVSGIVLLFERPIQIGDTVEVNNLIGNVESMGIRSSNIRTFDGAEVVVPNANLISNELINWTLSDQKRRIEIFSGVAYGSDVYNVKDILTGILNEHPDILQEPKPLVLFNDLGESSLDFRLLFWTGNYDRWVIIKSEVVFMIYDALNEAKISIPFPQRDLHIIQDKDDGVK